MEASDQPTPPDGRASHSRAGRPSTVARYAPLVEEWLREHPDLAGSEILRRIRLAGYGGGKSALYELVARVRVAGQRGIRLKA